MVQVDSLITKVTTAKKKYVNNIMAFCGLIVAVAFAIGQSKRYYPQYWTTKFS